jgi:hypothetical protein
MYTKMPPFCMFSSPLKVCCQEARRGIGWWKMGIWKLKDVRGNIEQGICPMCSKEEGWSRIFRCDETKSWRNDLVDKRFTSVDPKIGIRRVVSNKDGQITKIWVIFKHV